MTCVEFEVLLCDYLDSRSGRASALTSAQTSEIEGHMASCSGCAELARDAGAALHLLERASEVEPPPELLTRILFDLPLRQKQARNPGMVSRWLREWLGPFLQPRFAMGMALTVLSFSMMAQCAGVRIPQLRPSDLTPSRVWAGLGDRVHRTWERSVKSYESLRFVYEIQSKLREWTDQQSQEDRNAAEQSDDRRLPAASEANQDNQTTKANQTH